MPAPRKAPAPDARRDLEKELAAAGALKHQLGEAFGEHDDVQLMRDMIEGETNLDAAVDAVLSQMAMDLASIEGIKFFKQTMDARQKRLSDRVDTMRAMVLNAMDMLEQLRLDRPLAVLTRKNTPPKLLIVDEAAIPSQFYKQPDPELSKSDLTAALKDRRDTLNAKLEEISNAVHAGTMNQSDAAEATARAWSAIPAIPGAELDNGGIALQVRWS